MNDPPPLFSLLAPPDDFVADSVVIEFRWEQSSDVDEDTLDYLLHFEAVDYDSIMVFKIDTLVQLNVLEMDFPRDVSISWFVEVTDAEDTTASLEVFTFSVPDLVGVDDAAYLPTEYSLSQNYPNPFNPVTVIEYALPKSGEVRMIIYNLLGQEVARLVSGELDAGYHTVTWNASNVSSGIYFYRLQAGEFTRTRKMVLLK